MGVWCPNSQIIAVSSMSGWCSLDEHPTRIVRKSPTLLYSDLHLVGYHYLSKTHFLGSATLPIVNCSLQLEG